MPFQPVAVVYSSSNMPVPGWDEPQRAVGVQDVTVMLQATPIADLLASVLQTSNRLQQSVAILAGPRISMTAAQILMVGAGDAMHSSTCTRYTAMGATHPAIQQLSNLTLTPAASILPGADGVIERRNNMYAHCTSVASLDAEVSSCAQLIADNPSLRQLHKWECWAIDNYVHFKTAFPAHFST